MRGLLFISNVGDAVVLDLAQKLVLLRVHLS